MTTLVLVILALYMIWRSMVSTAIVKTLREIRDELRKMNERWDDPA